MRLLSFLELVETALRADGLDLSRAQVSRHVNYEAGLARMQLPGNISLTVQNFSLADGQLCLKAWWTDEQENQVGQQAFFDANGSDWKSAARQMAATKPGDLADEESTDEAADGSTLGMDSGLGGFRSAV